MQHYVLLESPVDALKALQQACMRLVLSNSESFDVFPWVKYEMLLTAHNSLRLCRLVCALS